MQPPGSDSVNVAVLARLFANTTNSYKYLLTLALLDALERRYGDTQELLRIPLRELGIGMLVNAWFPHTYFRLSFGPLDQVARMLDRFAPEAARTKFSFDRPGRERLRAHLDADLDEATLKGLLRFVVQRLLRGFFEEELRGTVDAKVDATLTSLAREGFTDRRPLYRVDPDRHLTLHPDWTAYLRHNLAIVRGWASWEWARYMQRRNPHVPAVSEKLFPPQQRASLAEQTRFWTHAAQHQPIHCLYTGRLLTPTTSALDHYLPWSFLAHDRLWNLLPVDPSANSSKSDSLPADHHLPGLVRLSASALLHTRPHYKPADWCRLTEGHVQELHVPAELIWADTLDSQLLTSALLEGYSRTVPTLTRLAEQLGFPSAWSWKAAA